MGPPAPAAKKKGRPVGAKDAKPRTHRPAVRVEPIPQAPRADNVAGAPAQAPRADTPRPAKETAEKPPEPRPEIEEPPSPPSPQTLYRETAKNLVALRGVLHANRRASIETTYSRKLASWPLL